MESGKVKEIKEKLQEEIFIANSFGDKLRKVPTKELENLLTLINELESENERLSAIQGSINCDLEYLHEKLTNAEIEVDDYKDRIDLLEEENETLRNAKVVYETVDYCAEDLRKAQDRIAELEKELEKEQINNINCDIELQYKEKRIAELEKGNEALSFAVNQGFNDCQSKTLKQFAERLKEKIQKCSGCYIPDCFESPTNEFAYSEIDVNKAIDGTLIETLEGV